MLCFGFFLYVVFWEGALNFVILRAKFPYIGEIPNDPTGNFLFSVPFRRLVSSDGRVPDCSAGGRGFEPQTGPTLRVLK